MAFEVKRPWKGLKNGFTFSKSSKLALSYKKKALNPIPGGDKNYLKDF